MTTPSIVYTSAKTLKLVGTINSSLKVDFFRRDTSLNVVHTVQLLIVCIYTMTCVSKLGTCILIGNCSTLHKVL